MKKISTSLLFILFSILAKSQTINIDEYPEYIVITAQNTKLFGGIGLEIDSKKSKYKTKFEELKHYLTASPIFKGKEVRTLTDLFNEMNEIGYEYVNAFLSTGTTAGATAGSANGSANLELEMNRNNIVFKKIKKEVKEVKE